MRLLYIEVDHLYDSSIYADLYHTNVFIFGLRVLHFIKRVNRTPTLDKDMLYEHAKSEFSKDLKRAEKARRKQTASKSQ